MQAYGYHSFIIYGCRVTEIGASQYGFFFLYNHSEFTTLIKFDLILEALFIISKHHQL